jgi:TRAP-type transport system periplasmic protein
MKRFTLAFAALAFAAGTASADTIVLRLGNDVAPTSIQARAGELFAEEVARRDVGIEVQVFHANQLGTGVQQIQNVALGLQEMVNTGYELYDVFASDIRIGSAPFTFEDREHFEAWVRSPAFEAIEEDIIANGNQRFVNLGTIWRRGPYRVMIATRPVLDLDDLAEVKLRVHESEAVMRYWGRDGLGSTVVVLPLADVYLSLRQGVVDAITMPLDLVVPMKFAEVGPHIMNTHDYPQFVAVSINEEVWQSMTDEQRQAVTESMDVAGAFYNAEIEKSVEQWLADIRSLGATIHDVDRTPFIDRMREKHRAWEAEGYWRAGLIDEIEALRRQ